MISCVACCNREINKHCIHSISFQFGKALQEAVTSDDISKSSRQICQVAVKERLTGSSQLHGNNLSRKVCRRGKAAAFFHNENLGIVIIRCRDYVSCFLHTVKDGHTRPDAVTLHGIKLYQLLIPVHAKDLQLPSEIITHSLANFHIESGVLTVITQIAERRILWIDPHDKDFPVIRKSNCAQRKDHDNGQCSGNNFFHKRFPPF